MNKPIPGMPLAGRHALITGASSGIGAETARRLSLAGARLTLLARREERLNSLAEQLGMAQVIVMDVRDHVGLEQALNNVKPDILVLNAGLARGTAPAFMNSAADIDEVIDVNIKGYLHILRSLLPGMLERAKAGLLQDVVQLGSVAGRQVYPGGGIYCMTKHAVRALYESLRVDAGGQGVRFTTVDPAMVETEFSEVRLGSQEAAAKVYQGVEALKPEDIADVIHFALTRPAHVNLGEIVVWPTAQASTTSVTRS